MGATYACTLASRRCPSCGSQRCKCTLRRCRRWCFRWGKPCTSATAPGCTGWPRSLSMCAAPAPTRGGWVSERADAQARQTGPQVWVAPFAHARCEPVPVHAPWQGAPDELNCPARQATLAVAIPSPAARHARTGACVYAPPLLSIGRRSKVRIRAGPAGALPPPPPALTDTRTCARQRVGSTAAQGIARQTQADGRPRGAVASRRALRAHARARVAVGIYTARCGGTTRLSPIGMPRGPAARPATHRWISAAALPSRPPARPVCCRRCPRAAHTTAGRRRCGACGTDVAARAGAVGAAIGAEAVVRASRAVGGHVAAERVGAAR